MAIVVAAMVAVGHAWSITAGLFLDDHAHYRQLREGDWSYRSAVGAARLGIVGDVMDLWSRHETGLRFYRPVAFWLMRVEYTVGGWRPAVMHVFSLAWHWSCAMLVGLIAWRLLGRWIWAGVAASLMAIHPGHVVTVHWIACQTELMATAFLLLATLCYARYAGWWRGRGQGFSTQSAEAKRENPVPLAAPSSALCTRREVPDTGGYLWMVLAAVFFAMALGCREHTIMWTAVIVLGDLAFRADWRRHIRAYALAGIVVVLYLAARQEALGGFPLPGRPYLMRPADPGFARYVVDKFVYYMIGLFAYVPVLPVGGTAYFAQHPGKMYGFFAGVVAGLALIVTGSRPRRWLLFPFAWATVFFVPLLPVFASCHHLYLPGAGMAWLLAAGLSLLAQPPLNLRPVIVATLVGAHAVHLAVLAYGYGWVCRAGTHVEDVVVREVVECGRPLRDGDHLFFINLPMLAYYAIPAIESETGVRNLRGHALTFSPWLLRMEQPGAVRQVDPHTLVVTAPAGSDYFDGVAGQTLLTMMGFSGAFKTGDQVAGTLFDVQVVEASANGTRCLKFTFREPLDSPNYHFFFGSPVRWAYPVLDGT